MIRAFFTALFVLLFVRFAVWAAHVLTGGRRGDEVSSGSGEDRRFQGASSSGSAGGFERGPGRQRRRGPPRVAPGEIVDVPFTEVPPPESTKRR